MRSSVRCRPPGLFTCSCGSHTQRRPIRPKTAASFAESQWLIIACGRYEGIDSRVFEYYGQQIDVLEVSIGDYVLAGGEAAALVIAEATIRLIPGVLGNAESAVDDSFAPDRKAGRSKARYLRSRSRGGPRGA